MSNAARKARKRAGLKHEHTTKVPTGSLSRREKLLSIEQRARLVAVAMEMGRTFWERGRASVPTFPSAIQAQTAPPKESE